MPLGTLKSHLINLYIYIFLMAQADKSMKGEGVHWTNVT